MEDHDPTEAISRTFTVVLMAAAQTGARIAAARKQALTDAARQSEEQARRLQAQYDSQRLAELRALQPVTSDRWWETAKPTAIADMYEISHRWSSNAPDPATAAAAGEAQTVIREQVLERYGVDLSREVSNPAEVLAATSELAERRAQENRLRAQGDVDRARADLLLAEAAAYDTLAGEQRTLGDELRSHVNYERGDEHDLAVFERAEKFQDASAALTNEADRQRADAAAATQNADWATTNADRLGAENDRAEAELTERAGGQNSMQNLRETAVGKDEAAATALNEQERLQTIVDGPRTADVPHDIDTQHAAAVGAVDSTAAEARRAHERAGQPAVAAKQVAADDYRAKAAEWDTPERLSALRSSLTDRKIDPQLIDARMITERGRRTPPNAAVQGSTTSAPKAKKSTAKTQSKKNTLGR